MGKAYYGSDREVDAENHQIEEKIIDLVKSLQEISEVMNKSDWLKVADARKSDYGRAARSIYRSRRAVDGMTEVSGLSASHGFDFLLDAYINACKGRELSISSACIGAGCPPATGLRWIGYLESIDMIERYENPKYKMRKFFKLTQKGNKKTENMIEIYFT